MKLFFSYASEDAAVVLQIYGRVASAFPDLEPWMDKFEIVGGQDLIDKIAAGMDDADKFFVFLSAASIEKPWVKAELHRALMAEIKGVKPEFVVPVKVGAIATFPPFIESKRYIDVEKLTEAEWLAEFRAAAIGQPLTKAVATEQNLEVTLAPAQDHPNAMGALVRPRYWAEEIGFELVTRFPIRETSWGFPGRSGMAQLSVRERKTDRSFALRIDNERLTPPHSFLMAVVFESDVDRLQGIIDFRRWDGTGGEATFRVMTFGKT
jgi:hypothetical protein